MLQNPKYYLGAENARNAQHGYIFDELIKRAFGADEVVIDGHHFMFEPKAAMDAHDLSKVNEMPSADTLLFDHDVMVEVFGTRAVEVMKVLASLPVNDGSRDQYLAGELRRLDAQALAEASQRDADRGLDWFDVNRAA